MKKTVTTIAFLCAASACMAFAQDQGSKAAGRDSHSGSQAVRAYYKGIELKAHEVFTDAEDAQHHKAYATAVKMPEVVAAARARNGTRRTQPCSRPIRPWAPSSKN